MALAKAPGVSSDVVDGVSILIGPAGTHVIELNAMGSLVWRSLDGHREESDVVAEVLAALDSGQQVGAEQVGADVRAFLSELRQHGLVV